MVTIAAFSKPEDAHLLRMRLEAGGVNACVQDENLVQVNWLWANAVGGVRVQVAERDIEKARKILADEGDETPGAVNVICPYCKSTRTEPDDTRRRISLLSLVLLNLPWLWPKNRYRCAACGHRWTERTRQATGETS